MKKSARKQADQRQHRSPGAYHAESLTISATIISTRRFSKHISSHVPGNFSLEERPDRMESWAG